MNNFEKILSIFVALVFVLLSLLIIDQHSSSINAGDSGYNNVIPTVDINQGVGVGPGLTTRVLSTSTARVYAYLSAASSTVPIYCNLSDSAATIGGSGITIGTSTPYTIDAMNLYTGSIQCVSPASTTLSVSAQQ